MGFSLKILCSGFATSLAFHTKPPKLPHEVLAFSRFDLHDCVGFLSANERIGATELFSTARSNKPLRRVRRDLKKLLPHRQNSRGDIVERVLSLDAHVHYQTEPSLLCTNRKRQTVEARFFSPRPARLCWFSVCERTAWSNRTVFNGARTNHSPRALPHLWSAVVSRTGCPQLPSLPGRAAVC